MNCGYPWETRHPPYSIHAWESLEDAIMEKCKTHMGNLKIETEASRRSLGFWIGDEHATYKTTSRSIFDEGTMRISGMTSHLATMPCSNLGSLHLDTKRGWKRALGFRSGQ